MKYDAEKGDLGSAYEAFKTGYREAVAIRQGLATARSSFGGFVFLLCLPGELLAVMTRVGIGERAFKLQAVLSVLLVAAMLMMTVYGPGAVPTGAGFTFGPLIGFGYLLLICFALQVAAIATRNRREVSVHSESEGHPLPFFYLVSTNETVIRMLVEPIALSVVILLVWRLYGGLLGGVLLWAVVGQLIESARLLDAERIVWREFRDAAIEAGHAGEVPDFNKDRAYEARRATVITAVWIIRVMIEAGRWVRRRFR